MGDIYDDHQYGDGEIDACELGDLQACYSLEFGSCADADPRIAIRACTRQLATQDNRKQPGQLRFGRAVRYALRARAHENQGNVASALSDYDLAVKADDSIFWIHTNRGYTNFRAGDYEEALESFGAAVALNPDSVSILVDRALLSAAAPDEELRDAPQALADARRANQLEPGQPTYIEVLACAYAANGDFDRALAEQRRAIDLLPASEQSTIESFGSQLDLYQQGMPCQMAPRPET